MKFQRQVQIPAHWETIEYPTILSALEDQRIFAIGKNTKGQWEIAESCDGANSLELSNAQLRGLANELIDLANEDDALRRARGITEGDSRIFPMMDAPPNED
jgi:hypothetical protein